MTRPPEESRLAHCQLCPIMAHSSLSLSLASTPLG